MNHLISLGFDALKKSENCASYEGGQYEVNKAIAFALLAIAEEMHDFNEAQGEFMKSIDTATE